MSAETETDFQSLLGIRMSERLRSKIREAAEIEHRTESAFARVHLDKASDQVIAENKPKRK